MQAGLALAVLTADCLPVVLVRRGAGSPTGLPTGSPIGIAHAGWRGITSGVLEQLLESMPCNPEELEVWLGPAIGPTVYQVGEDVREAVLSLPGGEKLAEQSLNRQSKARGSARYLFDLAQLAGHLLRRCGVETITASGLCTLGDPRFYSYRRDGVTGRMATLVWLPSP